MEWLMKLFNVHWKRTRNHRIAKTLCLLPTYKGKGDRKECSNFIGMSNDYIYIFE